MRHTESDLRELLDRYGRAPSGCEPSAGLDAIVRRGRGIRRTRRAVTAGAALALAVAATGLASGPLADLLRPREAVLAQPSPAAVPAGPGADLPGTMPVVLGADRFDLSLIHSRRFETVGVGETVTFTPTSHFTGNKVVCDDPRAWVVTDLPLRGGESGGTAGRCGDLAGGHHDRLSAPSGWLEGPQSMKVWVFPADAPVREVAEAVTGCRPVVKPGGCDEAAQVRALRDPEVRRRLSLRTGERPGGWTVGIYDRPAAAEPAPGDGSPAGTGLPAEGPSAPADRRGD
ncbi:hypothetical protein ACFOWE_21545 [Planomonospora corallina]|uniref:Uncharacterized protein n=1 Tax=Planomonospora corallina TaxID=1806052 RepID=A0ABV8ICK9_9ACTN